MLSMYVMYILLMTTYRNSLMHFRHLLSAELDKRVIFANMLPSPTIEDLKRISERLDFRCNKEDLLVYQVQQCYMHKTNKDAYQSVQRFVNLFNDAAKFNTPSEPSEAIRNLGYRAHSSQNPYNAWYWICNLKTTNEGSLHGKKVGIKDNIAIAGIPMMNGSRMLEGFVPTYDATVVTRILKNGGEIYGKTTCEDLCLSGTSYCTTYGPVTNPLNTSRVAGGSSSGSAAAVACGDVEMALGCDQGGSIRIPASYCGIVGMKPTFGLVPYTGCVSLLTCFDHVGPMARNVHDCALLLEAICGFDDYKDCRQPEMPFPTCQYSKEILKPTNKLRIGVLQEGFDICEPDVIKCIQNALKLIKQSKKFAVVDEISVPMHKEINKIYGGINLPGLYKQLIEGDGFGTGMYGTFDEQYSEKMHQALKTRAFMINSNTKGYLLTAAHVHNQGFDNQLYAKSSTLGYCLRKEYDKILEKYDVLMFPTLPNTASKIQSKDNLSEYMAAASGMFDNVKSFNVTHHPALSLNAGYSDVNDLPVGLQIVGKHWQDATVLQVAASVENILSHLQKEFR